MSIDMTMVKSIMHNNKQVVKIEDSNGNVMWKKELSSVINFVVTNSGEVNNLYASIVYKNGTTQNIYTSTNISINRDDINIIKIYHMHSKSNSYSVVIIDGYLEQSNSTSSVIDYTIYPSSIISKIEIDFNYSSSNYVPICAFIIRDSIDLSYTPIIFKTYNGSYLYNYMMIDKTKQYIPSSVTRYTIDNNKSSARLEFAGYKTGTSIVGYGVDITVSTVGNNKIGEVDRPVNNTYKYIVANGYRTSSSVSGTTYLSIIGRKK